MLISKGRLTAGIAAVLVMAATLVGITSTAEAASDAAVSIAPQNPSTSPATQAVGSPFSYRINYACNDCTDVKLTIPLGGAAGLIIVNNEGLPQTITGGVLTIDVGALDGSRTLILTVSGAPGTTPNNATWTFTPTITATGLAPVISTTSVTGTYTAMFFLTGQKTAPAAAVVDENFTYDISIGCHQRHAGAITVTDPLPAGVEFVSASHGGTLIGTTVTWNLTGADLGGSCGPGTSTPLKLTVKATDAALNGQPQGSIVNVATINATSLDGETASIDVNRYTTIYGRSTYPDGTFLKFAASGRDLYPGEELDYQLQARQARDGYTVSAVDPIPCRTNLTGTTYSSLTTGVCTDPLIAVTYISTIQFPPTGWAPQVRYVDGSVETLTGTDRRYPVPAGKKVAEVIIPAVPVDNDEDIFVINIHGTMTHDIAEGSQVDNIATATFTKPDATTNEVTASNFNIIKSATEMWATKSLPTDFPPWFYEAYGVYAGGIVRTARPLTNDITLTDLLPLDHYIRTDLPHTVQIWVEERGEHLDLDVPYEIIDDFAGTGRQLIRVRIPAATLNDLITDWSTPPIDFDPTMIFSAMAPAPGQIVNQSQIFYDDAAATTCRFSSSTYTDTLDLDGNPDTKTACVTRANATLWDDQNSTGFSLIKQVKGDQDGSFKPAPGVGIVSNSGGSADYTLTFVNQSPDPIDNPVIYEILPRVGDTKVMDPNTPRNSAFPVTLDSVGPLPAGFSVQYSLATNPCRPEVLAVNVGCTDDWTATAPADLDQVTALRFASTNSYNRYEYARIPLSVTTPDFADGDIAWNSAAATGSIDGVPLLPYEARAVGVGTTAPESGTVTFEKTVDKATAAPGDTLTYTITVDNGTADDAFFQAVDVLPDGVTYVSSTPAGQAFPDPDSDPDMAIDWSTNPYSGAWLFSGVAPAGGSTELTITATVDDGTLGQTLTNYGIAAGPTGPIEISDNACDDATNAAVADVVFGGNPEFAGSCASTVIALPTTTSTTTTTLPGSTTTEPGSTTTEPGPATTELEAPTTVPSSQAPTGTTPPATPPATNAPDALPRTGTPPWTQPAAALGAAMVVLGLALARRRTAA